MINFKELAVKDIVMYNGIEYIVSEIKLLEDLSVSYKFVSEYNQIFTIGVTNEFYNIANAFEVFGYDFELEDLTEKVYVPCIGVDDKIHIYYPDKNECRCGVKVKKKVVTKKDYNFHFSCYECTY